MLQLMGAFAQFEREIIFERQRKELNLPLLKGSTKAGYIKLKPEQAEAFRQDWTQGKYSSKVDSAKAFGISRQAVYQYLKRGSDEIRLRRVVAVQRNWHVNGFVAQTYL